MNEIHLTTLKCERCGHTWIPRKPQKPQTCPKCRSPYWQTKRWKGVRKGGKPIGVSQTSTQRTKNKAKGGSGSLGRFARF